MKKRMLDIDERLFLLYITCGQGSLTVWGELGVGLGLR